MRPPYDARITGLLESSIQSGLSLLKNTGRTVNYEEFCHAVGNSFASRYFMPEWEHYWKYWKTAFDDIFSKKARLALFKELLQDLVHKGLLRSEIHGLTANFSDVISEILTKKASEDAMK